MSIENQLHFIVGMSRSGSTWMQESLKMHSQIYSFGETCFFGKHFLNKELYSKKDIEKLIPINLSSGISTTDFEEFGGLNEVIRGVLQGKEDIKPEDLFSLIIDELRKKSHKSIIVEKTPHHVNSIDLIRGYFPDSKFIVMKRRASSFMLSYKHQGDRKPKKVKRNFARLYHPIGCLMVYRKYYNSIKGCENKDYAIIIDNGEIISNPVGVIRSIHNFLEVPFEEVFQGKNINTSFPGKKPELKVEDKVWLKLFGHGDQVSLKQIEYFLFPLLFIYSIIKLIPWFFFVIGNFSKRSAGNYIKYFISYIKK